MEKTLEELWKQFTDLRDLVYRHKHTKNDQTEKLAATTQVYGGQVASDGTAVKLPTGWTSSHTGTGQLRITHNLGNLNYAAVATPLTANQITVFIADRQTTYVEFWIRDTSGIAQDKYIDFIVVPIV